MGDLFDKSYVDDMTWGKSIPDDNRSVCVCVCLYVCVCVTFVSTGLVLTKIRNVKNDIYSF